MSAPALPLLVLVTLVSVVVTAPAQCPATRLCRMVCKISPVLAARCESCHPGVCLRDGKKEVKSVVVHRAPPQAKSGVTDNGSIDVDDDTPVTQASAPEESIEKDDEDISDGGSGAVDDEGSEPAESNTGDETIEDVLATSDEKAALNEPKPEEIEPVETEPEEADPKQPESEEKEPEQVALETLEPSEPEAEEPEAEEGKPEEIEPEAEKTEHDSSKPEDTKPDETEEESREAESAEDESEEAAHSKDPAVSSATPSPRGNKRSRKISALACLHSGIYHPLHSTWFDMDHCNLHVCTIHGVQTTSLTGACLPPPDDMTHCRRYRLPGQCCYTYDCQSPGNGTTSPQSCIDQFGVERQHNEHWVDDPNHPCVRFFCADGVVVVLSDMRPLCPVPPSHGCTAFQPQGMCCNDFNCTDAPVLLSCIDEQNVRRDNGQIWYDNDAIPCRKFVCNNGTVELLKDLSASCPLPPGPGCAPLSVLGRCCPTYTNCSCLLGGVEFLSGAMFPDDQTFPCRRLECNNGTIVTLEERLCPFLSCSPTFRRPGSCCYECVGCMHEGVRRPEGSFWYDDPQRPCVLFTCSNSLVVEVNRTECAPSPGSNCQPIFLSGDCCAMYDCSGVTCPYGDQIYHEDDVWVDNPVYPCKWFTCRRTGVQQVNNTYCPSLVPRDCSNQRDPGECCYTCQTIVSRPTCFYNGQTYQEGDVWVDNPVYPCKWFTCRRTGVQQVNNTYCPPLVPRDCSSQRDQGECCYSCQTIGQSRCVDNSGVVREDGELYYIDPERCMLARCVGDEEVLLVDRTKLCPPPPNINCTVVGLVNCCPQYLCHLMPISNCTDAAGESREDGEIYANDADGCVLVQCVDGSEKLLVDRSTLCPPPDNADGSCVQTGVQDCCPVYDCSDPVNCVDVFGTQHSEGDKYYDDSVGCVLVECSDGQEVTLMDKTELCGPVPENPACTVQGTLDCCPIYSCPDCTYNSTTYPIGAHWWDDPQRQCIRYRCSSQGLVEQVLTRLPCAEVRYGCVPIRDEPACCHHKYNCMFDYEHVLIPTTELPY